jgi:hypothetical protein
MQASTARALEIQGKNNNIKFVLNTGDSFYE